MGYQEAIPPVPTRDQELQMIEKFETSWLDQPWNRFYMNQNLRIAKMRRQFKRQYVRKEFLQNVLFYSLLFAPVLYLSKRFFINRNGLPFYADFKYNNVFVKSDDARRRAFIKVALPTYFLGTYAAAKLSTDRSPIIDYTYQQVKDQKWL